MKKKLLLTAFVLGAFLLGSCENLIQDDPPHDLAFTGAELNADTAQAGATAGSFSAEGGSGALAYSLVAGADADDNGCFAVEGAALKLAASLGEGEYFFRARVEDEEGQSEEKGFTLRVGPAEEKGDPEEPEAPETPDRPSEPETPGEPEAPEVPEAPETPGEPAEPGGPGEPESPEEPEAPEAPETPGEPGDPENPGEPEDPEAPEEPEAPETPGQPGDPENPEDPEAPEAPETPGQPGGPGQPGAPEIPGGPETPGEPGEPNDPGIAAPPRVTGVASSPGMQWVALTWTAAARATSYEVYYSAGSDFAAATKFSVEPAGTSVKVTGLEDSVVYTFWVVAKNAGGTATPSRPHTAVRTSDPIPDYMRLFATPGGPVIYYGAGGGTGDTYVFQDLGTDYPPDERYRFGYGYFGDSVGTIKFVRQFADPPEEPAVALMTTRVPIYDSPYDKNRGVIIYQYNKSGNERFAGTYYMDAHAETYDHPGTYYAPDGCHAPEAVMGQANSYSSGSNGSAGSGYTVEWATLEEAVAKFCKIGGPPIGGGGRYDYWSYMMIYYSLSPDSRAAAPSMRSALSKFNFSSSN
jgi:hypothetical protein